MAERTRSSRRPSPPPPISWRTTVLASLCLLLCCLALPATAQSQPTAIASRSGTSTSLPSTTTSASLVAASQTPYALTNAVTVQSTIQIANGSDSAAFFSLALSGDDQQAPVYVSVSLCSGPNDGVVPEISANASSSTRDSLIQSSLVRMYVALSDANTMPGPDLVPSGSGGDMTYAAGGYASLDFNTDGSDTIQNVYVSVYPPEKSWDTTGSFNIQVVVSSGAPVQMLQNNYGLVLDDTDSTRALVTSYNYSTALAPNISLVVLPTLGDYSLPSSYYNSSFCAIASAWQSFLASDQRPQINSSETTRGVTRTYAANDTARDVRLQFEIANLEVGYNYTAWLVSANTTGRNDSTSFTGTSLYPAIKFLTKLSPLCRLVWDVDFCPEVAYSLPIAEDVNTFDALSIINQTVAPNYANFSKTLSTWPCEDSYFGQYSTVQGCSNCLEAYQNWLCAVTMPRCTDAVTHTNQSAAESNVDDLRGKATGVNTDLLPYVINRNGSNVRNDIPGELGVTTYGELLPCLYTCLFVQRNCPAPLFQWVCPSWGISAQHDYGTFADAGADGLGAGENGGAGSDLSRWGGPLRYIATDAFGNVFCNSLGVDVTLRSANGAWSGMGGQGWVALTIGTLSVIMLLVV